jgi:hypothetical protein
MTAMEAGEDQRDARQHWGMLFDSNFCSQYPHLWMKVPTQWTEWHIRRGVTWERVLDWAITKNYPIDKVFEHGVQRGLPERIE